jgi:hypothetical protein
MKIGELIFIERKRIVLRLGYRKVVVLKQN